MKTEERYLSELDTIREDFGAQVSIFSEVEAVVEQPIGDQILAKWRKQDHSDAEQEAECTLADCMEEYYIMAAQEDEDLAPLWEQWSEAQAEMICLAVEILGEHNIDVGHHNLSNRLAKGISDAEIKHKENENRYTEAEQSMVNIKADLVALCDETTKTVKAQQKASQVSCVNTIAFTDRYTCRPGGWSAIRCWRTSSKLWQISRRTNEGIEMVEEF
jgi:hypothetical protein